jgi:predicted dehydrogenase
VQRLRVGVIGLGVGEKHALAYAQDPRCELTALCDHSEERLAHVGSDYPDARCTTDAGALLADPELDLVSIASFDDNHFEQALAALRAGKHVFCEKPLCRTLDETRALAEALRMRSDTHLMSNLVLRSAPLYRWLRDQVDAEALGTLYSFDGDYLYGRLHKITEGWRRDVDGYSVMLGGGIHLVDLMLWLSRERPATVAASGNGIATEGSRFRYQDYVAALFEFPSGLVGRVTANFACVHAHQHVVRMFGTEATFIYDDAGARLYTDRAPDTAPRLIEAAPLPPTKAELIPEFVAGILDGGDVRSQTQHDLDVVAACVAADRALAEGGRVDIEYA